MKKLVVCIVGIMAALLLLNGCGMKECKCLSSNQVSQNDSIIKYTVDTVYNNTRGDCGIFDKDEIFHMDTNIQVHHIITCQEN
jgi:hypothetical protein